MRETYETEPLEFITKHFPQLLTEEGQIQYFRTYEFSSKQTNFKQFWHRVLKQYFNHFQQKSMVLYEDIELAFTINGNRPLGLSALLMEFASE